MKVRILPLQFLLPEKIKMKGTISPELRAILANPLTSRAFQEGFLNRDRSIPTSNIDLGNGQAVTVRNFWATAPKKKRTLLQILFGR